MSLTFAKTDQLLRYLPFDDLIAEKVDDYFSKGLVEEIKSALVCVNWLRLVASGSVLASPQDEVDAAQANRPFAARYVVNGAVRRSGSNVRVTVGLVDALTGDLLWGDRFEGPSANIFEIQDIFTEKIVGILQPTILDAEARRSRNKGTIDRSAYDYILQAFPLVWRLEQQQNDQARELLNAAIKCDPEYPLALSLLAWCYAREQPIIGLIT